MKELNFEKYDAVVIGAGFAGSVVARQLANRGKNVVIIDKRSHIGGNMYEMYKKNGIRVHLYGPHIFHTNNQQVFDYLKEFSEFYKYEHKVLGKIDEKLVPIPFNFTSLEMLFSENDAVEIKNALLENFPKKKKVSILDLKNHQSLIIKKFGEYVFEKVFVHYTAKQWGVPVGCVDTSVINRVPVVLGYDDRYFDDSIQFMPLNGFTDLFERMLDHSNIKIVLNKNALDIVKLDIVNNNILINDKVYSGTCVFTGAVDELLNFKYGALPYRSLNLVFEDYDTDFYQTNSVVNYPNEEEFTRITEFKYLTKQNLQNKTTILKEYPLKFDERMAQKRDPYYPITNQENNEKYNLYKDHIDKISNLYLVGRLAEYKYYNMDSVIDQALMLCDQIENNKK